MLLPVCEATAKAWEGWLAARRAERAQRTVEIVRLETQLNARVYTLFEAKSEHSRVIRPAD